MIKSYKNVDPFQFIDHPMLSLISQHAGASVNLPYHGAVPNTAIFLYSMWNMFGRSGICLKWEIILVTLVIQACAKFVPLVSITIMWYCMDFWRVQRYHLLFYWNTTFFQWMLSQANTWQPHLQCNLSQLVCRLLKVKGQCLAAILNG